MVQKLSELTDEAREQLAQVLEDEAGDSPQDAPADDDKTPTKEESKGEKAKVKPKTVKPPKKDEQPEWLSALVQTQKDFQESQLGSLKELIENLENSNRTLQGQVRSLESRLGQASRRVEPQETDVFKDLDMSDPGVAALAGIVRPLINRLAVLERGQQNVSMNAEEQQFRQGWMTFLEDMATDIGIPWQDVYSQISRLGNEQLATEGRRIIAQAVKGNKSAEDKGTDEDAEKKKIETAQREAVTNALKTLGIYDEVRGTIGGLGEKDIEAIGAKLEAFNRDPESMTTEELEALGKQLK